MSMHLQELIGLKAIHSIEHEDVMVKLLALSLRDKAAMWPSSGWAFSPYGNRVGKEIFQMPYYSPRSPPTIRLIFDIYPYYSPRQGQYLPIILLLRLF